jgi:hypothetical protein
MRLVLLDEMCAAYERTQRAAMAPAHLSPLRQIWPRYRRNRRRRRSGRSPILRLRRKEPRKKPMKTNRPEPNLELHQPEPFRVAFALFALVLGALAALQF